MARAAAAARWLNPRPGAGDLLGFGAAEADAVARVVRIRAAETEHAGVAAAVPKAAADERTARPVDIAVGAVTHAFLICRERGSRQRDGILAHAPGHEAARGALHVIECVSEDIAGRAVDALTAWQNMVGALVSVRRDVVGRLRAANGAAMQPLEDVADSDLAARPVFRLLADQVAHGQFLRLAGQLQTGGVASCYGIGELDSHPGLGRYAVRDGAVHALAGRVAAVLERRNDGAVGQRGFGDRDEMLVAELARIRVSAGGALVVVVQCRSCLCHVPLHLVGELME